MITTRPPEKMRGTRAAAAKWLNECRDRGRVLKLDQHNAPFPDRKRCHMLSMYVVIERRKPVRLVGFKLEPDPAKP